MSFYPKEISAHYSHPQNAGRAKFVNALGTNASFVCGCALRFTLEISDKKIVEAKFQTNGCGFMIATAEILVETITGKALAELHGLEDLGKMITQNLGGFPESRQHCQRLAIETLHAAFNDFRSAQLEEFAGEKTVICTCFGVLEETIENIILENHCEIVEDVSSLCNAGNGCGSCQPLIQHMIDKANFDI